MANRLASPFLFDPLFFFYFRHPPFIQSVKTKLIFILSSIRSCSCSCSYCFKSSSSSSSSSVFDCSYLQNVLELRNYAKHTINATTTMIVLNTHLLLCPPIIPSDIPSVTPRKKTTIFYPLRI